MKLFRNFTRHHLITHSNSLENNQRSNKIKHYFLLEGRFATVVLLIIFLLMYFFKKCKDLILRVLLSILFIFLDLDRPMSTVHSLY